MSTAGGGFKLGPTVWLRGNQYEGWLSSLSLVKQRGSSWSRIAENVWMNFFFPPIAGPLSNNPTWIPNWLPLEMALQKRSIRNYAKANYGGTTYANRTWFTTLATNEANGNAQWAKYRAGSNKILVQLKLIPGYVPTLPHVN